MIMNALMKFRSFWFISDSEIEINVLFYTPHLYIETTTAALLYRYLVYTNNRFNFFYRSAVYTSVHCVYCVCANNIINARART